MTGGAPAPANALSFDVEDYFQVSAFEGRVRFEDWPTYPSRVLESTTRILDLLAEAGGVRATFFVLGWVAEHHPEVVRRIAAGGHEVASHGSRHRRVHRMAPGEFREDVLRSKDLLESIAGTPVIGFRAPSFSIVRESLWALEILAELGFLYDSSIFPIRRRGYGIPGYERFPHRITLGGPEGGGIVEFPLTTARLGKVALPVAGGGYMRIFSTRFVRWGLRRVEAEGGPAIVYLHPWELDPGQPRLPCGLLTRFRHYRGLGRTRDGLRSLLREFSFGTAAGVLEARGLLRPSPKA